jgi:hypothetical protein
VTRDLAWVLDYIAIRDLSARYNRFAEVGDGERYADCWTEDGELDLVGSQVFRGRQELAGVGAAGALTTHITTDPLIEVDGDVARQTSRLITTYKAPDRSANEFVGTGIYTDELRRTADGWRFHRRRVDLDLEPSEVFRKSHIEEAFARLAEAGSASSVAG